MKRTLAAAALVALPALAGAHDLWLEPGGPGLVLRLGHRGRELLPIDAAKVKAARCLEHGGSRDLLPTGAPGPREVAFAGRCEAASALLDRGSWSLTPEGKVNRPRREVPRAVSSWASRQFAKWVDAGSPGAAAAVLGDELELVAAGDLSRARMGDTVALRVLSAGAPVPGAVVDADDVPLGTSDAAGLVRVKLRTAGITVLNVTLRRKGATPDADQLVLEASLTFQVAR